VQFEKPEEYYSTLFHEIGHSTGAESRLKRKTLVEANCFGDHMYSQEELVAEFYASMMCSRVGIEQLVLENSAAYIKSWYKKLKGKPEDLVVALRQARKAFEYTLEGENAFMVADKAS
jgi:antirestriction protein ArdC